MRKLTEKIGILLAIIFNRKFTPYKGIIQMEYRCVLDKKNLSYIFQDKKVKLENWDLEAEMHYWLVDKYNVYIYICFVYKYTLIVICCIYTHAQMLTSEYSSA